MSIHKFKTAMVVELEVEFEYIRGENGSFNCAPTSDEIGIQWIKAHIPERGTDDWDDIREECFEHIAKLSRDAEEYAADAADFKYHRAVDERMVMR